MLQWLPMVALTVENSKDRYEREIGSGEALLNYETGSSSCLAPFSVDHFLAMSECFFYIS